MKKAFEEAYGKVQAPDTLKAETLALMEAEEKKQSLKTQKAGGKRRAVWCCGMVAAALCVVVICLLVWPGRGAVYITPMEDGVCHDRVELKDGVLYFQSERVVISVTPNAGNTTSGEKPDKTGVGEEDVSPVEVVTAKSGGTLVLYRQDSLTLPEVTEEGWSHIGGQQVYVTVLKTEGIRYQATYEKDGEVCEITGEGVSQKEFIDYLYQKIKE